MAIRRYLNERKEIKKTNINKIEVEEIQIDQRSTKNQSTIVGNAENFKPKNYLQLKHQLIQNLDQITSIDDHKYVRKSDLREIIIQELDLVTQLLDK